MNSSFAFLKNYTKSRVGTAALQRAHVDPTPAQKAAGNYAKTHVKLHGLAISIENPRGSVRSGVDKNGRPWSVVMQHHYGYFKRTEGADGDHVDVFVGPAEDSELVYIVNQTGPDGKFDEHKVMMGFSSLEDARAGYLLNYTPGWKGLGEIVSFTREQFKTWLRNHDTQAPAKEFTKSGESNMQSTAEKLEALQEFSKAQRREEGETWTQPSGRKVTKKGGQIVAVGENRDGKPAASGSESATGEQGPVVKQGTHGGIRNGANGKTLRFALPVAIRMAGAHFSEAAPKRKAEAVKALAKSSPGIRKKIEKLAADNFAAVRKSVTFTEAESQKIMEHGFVTNMHYIMGPLDEGEEGEAGPKHGTDLEADIYGLWSAARRARLS